MRLCNEAVVFVTLAFSLCPRSLAIPDVAFVRLAMIRIMLRRLAVNPSL